MCPPDFDLVQLTSCMIISIQSSQLDIQFQRTLVNISISHKLYKRSRLSTRTKKYRMKIVISVLIMTKTKQPINKNIKLKSIDNYKF